MFNWVLNMPLVMINHLQGILLATSYQLKRSKLLSLMIAIMWAYKTPFVPENETIIWAHSKSTFTQDVRTVSVKME